MVETTVSNSLTGGGTFTCTNTFIVSGTLSMQLETSGNLLVGVATIKGTQTDTGVSGDSSCKRKETLSIGWSEAISALPRAWHRDAPEVKATMMPSR